MQPSQPTHRTPGQMPNFGAPAHARPPETATAPTKADPFEGRSHPRQMQPVVRYRTKMMRGQLFPLVVTLKEEGKPLVKKDQIMPDGSAATITIYPIIPGAQVTPTSIDVSAVPGSEASFFVVPLTRGKLPNARVELRSGGKVVGSVALAMRAGTRRLTRFLAFLTIVIPCLLLYVRTHPMVELQPEFPKEDVAKKAVEPGTPTPGRPVGPQLPPGGGRPGGGAPGGGRPGGQGNGNRGSNSQPLPQPPAGETPKKDKDAETPKKEGGSLEIALLLQQPESGAAKEKQEQDKSAETKKPADDKKPAADEKKDDKKPADGAKKPDGAEPGERRPPFQMPPMPRQPPGAVQPVKPVPETGPMQYTLRREGRPAFDYWLHKIAKQIHYPHDASTVETSLKDAPAPKATGEVHIGDSGDALGAAICWLNYDAFTWLNKGNLPEWSFTYCFDYVLGENWKPNAALSSMYGQILDAPFLELFALAALFVLTLLVRMIQDPKRRSTTGTAFAI